VRRTQIGLALFFPNWLWKAEFRLPDYEFMVRQCFQALGEGNPTPLNRCERQALIRQSELAILAGVTSR
jgi:hypothetical protein